MLRKSKHQTCEGCAALQESSVKGEVPFVCVLGYKVTFRYFRGLPVRPTPRDPCERPDTFDELRAILPTAG